VIAAHNGGAIFWAAGQAGVVLFFVLSGFLITRILASQIASNGRLDYRRFYLRRAARLGPAVLIYLAGCLTYSAIQRPNAVRGQLEQLPYVLLYVTNWRHIWLSDAMPVVFGSLWSLAIEEQFYLLWPIVLAILLGMRRWRLVVALAIGIALSLLLRLYFSFHASPQDHLRSYLGTDTNAFALLLGSAIALATLHGWRPKRPAAMVTAGAAMSLAAAMWPASLMRMFSGSALGVPASFGAALLVAAVPTWGGRAVDAPPLRFIGKVAYGWYLWQSLAIWVVPGEKLASAVIGFALAILSWYLVESPILRRVSRDRVPTVGQAARVARSAPDA